MQQFQARIHWQRGNQPFTDQRYSRAHLWQLDGGLQVPCSSSPLSVPLPMSDPAAIDPEEALVAAVSSCHMLFFLSIAAGQGYLVDDYRDDALGSMDSNADGRLAMTLITLRPSITFGGAHRPGSAALAALHHEAHQQCYIANSIKADVVIESKE